MTRQCWICYLEEEEPEWDDQRWVQPCKCLGSTRWVHQSCLLAWIDSQLSRSGNEVVRQAGGPLVTPSYLCCPQCHTPYRVQELYLIPGSVLRIIDTIIALKESILNVSLFFTFGASVWVLCGLHGTTTFIISVGPEDAKRFFWDCFGPFARYIFQDGVVPSVFDFRKAIVKLFVELPSIPFLLLSFRYDKFLFVPWTSMMLSAATGRIPWDPWTQRSTVLFAPFVYHGYTTLRRRWFADRLFSRKRSSLSDPDILVPLDEEEEDVEVVNVTKDSLSWLLSMPVVSSAVGWLLFRKLPISRFHKTCLGGAVVVLVSDAGRILYKYQADYLKRSRRILDYSPLY